MKVQQVESTWIYRSFQAPGEGRSVQLFVLYPIILSLELRTVWATVSFLEKQATAKIDVNYKNLGWQITQDLFALGKSTSKLEQAVSLAGVVFQHGRALGLLYAKHGITV